MGGYAYTDAEITRAITGALAGAVVAQVPKHTVSMWNRYDLTPFLGLGLGVVHRSSMYAALDNTVLLPGFTRMDAAMFVRLNKILRVQANIENIAPLYTSPTSITLHPPTIITTSCRAHRASSG